uniref:Uncharacterized protein n=1 Tax=Calcidiscus leptoporus TaxID=127549 RepID=A0A6U5NQN3_9EUKA
MLSAALAPGPTTSALVSTGLAAALAAAPAALETAQAMIDSLTTGSAKAVLAARSTALFDAASVSSPHSQSSSSLSPGSGIFTQYTPPCLTSPAALVLGGGCGSRGGAFSSSVSLPKVAAANDEDDAAAHSPCGHFGGGELPCRATWRSAHNSSSSLLNYRLLAASSQHAQQQWLLPTSPAYSLPLPMAAGIPVSYYEDSRASGQLQHLHVPLEGVPLHLPCLPMHKNDPKAPLMP